MQPKALYCIDPKCKIIVEQIGVKSSHGSFCDDRRVKAQS